MSYDSFTQRECIHFGEDRDFTSLARELEAAGAIATRADQLRPLFEQIDSLVVDGADESTRRYTLRAMLAAIFEAMTGTDTAFDSPKKNIKFWLVLALFIWAKTNACHEADLRSSERAEARRVQREQAETIAMLTETVRRAVEEISHLKTTPAIYLEIRELSILRDAPSGQSARAGRLDVGDIVRLVSRVERWRYVELLDDHLQGTGNYGWIYQRNLIEIVNAINAGNLEEIFEKPCGCREDRGVTWPRPLN